MISCFHKHQYPKKSVLTLMLMLNYPLTLTNLSVSYWMSKGHLGIKNGLSIEVYGDNGSLKWELLDPDHLVQSDINSNQSKINRGSILRKLNQLDRFKPGHPTGFIEAFASAVSAFALMV